MTEVEKLKNIVVECSSEIRKKKRKENLKESLRPLISLILNEISTVNKPELDAEDKEKINKGYNKNGNERLDKENVKMKNELETLVHNINSDWLVYWDDHNELNVDAKNLLRVRISPKFENNYDIDAMVKLVDRIRVIGINWEQVKDFVKTNFSNLENVTKADVAKNKAINHYKGSVENGRSLPNYKETDEKNKKDAGPRHDTMKLKTGNVKDSKRNDKDYNVKQVEKDDDLPSSPMKDVGEIPSKNKKILKTSRVKPIKYKTENDLRISDKKAKKFTEKNK